MSDKRNKHRYPKRLQIRFGPESPEKVAYTGDLSEEGLFVRTVVAKFIHGKVLIEISTPEGDPVILEAQIRWAKRVPPQMIHKYPKAGLGLRITRFISGEERYRHIIENLAIDPV
ncbi:pilus protein PilZ [Desulfuromonas versatilis]|uniref:Pilus protein PilZ n=1 Tax=Desulfuromonas versatilis TaxID=2802975 RepID=A0ABM8HW30_9BACT|nr:PilZ domain-containing protein [Desulfuromonas versatilis]BCR04771.1 pilus protein PilZ [Desulfuromonas versatilis]